MTAWLARHPNQPQTLDQLNTPRRPFRHVDNRDRTTPSAGAPGPDATTGEAIRELTLDTTRKDQPQNSAKPEP